MSDDPLATDPNWSAVARFLEGRVARGQRVNAPPPFSRVTGPISAPDPAIIPDWAVIHKGQLDEYPADALRRVAAETTPVFANDVFVVFARRPTFGLRTQRGSVHVNALYGRVGELAGDGARPRPSPPAPPPPAAPTPPPVEAPRVAAPAPPAPALPPEALALLRPPAAAGAIPGWDGLRARVVALLADHPATRIAEIGSSGLSAALGAAGPLGGGTDAVILRVTEMGRLEDGLATAGDLLAPDGRLLVVADNADSLGRRLARAAARHTEAGLSLADLRAALRATGFRATRAEGFSLDPWRANAPSPPPDQAPGTPAGDILDAAGADAGPDYAALLLVLAFRA